MLRVERRPGPGETVTGADLALFPGSKGAYGIVTVDLCASTWKADR